MMLEGPIILDGPMLGGVFPGLVGLGGARPVPVYVVVQL